MKSFIITETLTITGGGEDAVELEVESEVLVDYHIEPGQKGGREDPSWDASVELEGATRVQDLVIGGVTVASKGQAVDVPEDQREEIEGEIIEYLREP